MRYLLFYDGECGLCHAAVKFVLKHDKKKAFRFAPLKGVTAQKVLLSPIQEDSLVLAENLTADHPNLTLSGKGAVRILWLLGGIWAVPGLLSYLPGSVLNPCYRFIAKRRHWFFKPPSCAIPSQADSSRFLP
jgi:predicted DCC family thiol-disulfide oxidoreductase YuxK